MGAVLQFKPRAPAPLDLRHGSWVVAVTCREWKKLEKPELEFQGYLSGCALHYWLVAPDGATGTFYQIMPVTEFERSRG